MNNSRQKIWYQKIVEKITNYEASIWGGSLNHQVIAKLKGLQRMFLLPISRGYNDISTDGLMVLVGTPPMHLIVQYEYQRAHYNYLKTRSEIRKYFSENVSVQES